MQKLIKQHETKNAVTKIKMKESTKKKFGEKMPIFRQDGALN